MSGLDALGVLAAFGSMLTFAIYVVGSERSGQRHEAVTTLSWAFGFATLFWALVTPWWSFPWEGLASTRNAPLAVALVVAGTLVSFFLTVAALRHVPRPSGGGDRHARARPGRRVRMDHPVAWVQTRRPNP